VEDRDTIPEWKVTPICKCKVATETSMDTADKDKDKALVAHREVEK
jgi:hypothetical protein